MKRMTFSVVMVCVLLFAALSIVHSQSAEDLIRDQSPGVVYFNTWVENGVRYLNRFIIRGNEITWMQTIGQETHVAGLSPYKITSTRKEGNKIILETDRGGIFIINGDMMQKAGNNQVIFTRER